MSKYILTTCLTLLLYACGNTQQVNQAIYPKQVGDIAYDKVLDDTAFKPCNEERIVQYYNFSKGL